MFEGCLTDRIEYVAFNSSDTFTLCYTDDTYYATKCKKNEIIKLLSSSRTSVPKCMV